MKVTLVVVLVLVLAAGVWFWLMGKHTPAPLAAAISSAQSAVTNAVSSKAAASTNASSTNVELTTNAPPSAATDRDVPTNAPAASAPTADLASATNAPATNAPPAEASSPPVVFYEDNFTRDGEVNNSEPDPKNTKQNSWTVTEGDGVYTVTSGKASPGNGAYDAVFLPVNADSGVTLDGKQNFTLSATFIPDKTNHWMGIGLNSQVIIPGHNIFDFAIANITLADGYAEAYQNHNSIKQVTETSMAEKPHVVSLAYHAKSGSITCSIDDQTLASIPVSVSDIASLAAVSFGNGAAGPTYGVSHFKLSVGGEAD